MEEEKKEEDLLKELDEEISKIKPEEETPKDGEIKVPTEKEFKSLDAQKRLWRDKAEKLEKQLSERGLGKSQDVDPMEVVKLAQALKDHDENEIDFIVRNAKSSRAEDIIKASKDEMVSLAIEAKRKKANAEKKVPSGGTSEFGSKTKDWRDIQKLKPEEFEKYEREQLEAGSGI